MGDLPLQTFDARLPAVFPLFSGLLDAGDYNLVRSEPSWRRNGPSIAEYEMLAGKRYKSVMMSVLIVLVAVAGREARGQTGQASTWGQPEMLATGQHWLSQDLHLTTGTLLSSKVAPGQHLLLGQEGFTMTVKGRQYTSRRGLVWIARGSFRTRATRSRSISPIGSPAARGATDRTPVSRRRCSNGAKPWW